jgi:hypothetical protein
MHFTLTLYVIQKWGVLKYKLSNVMGKVTLSFDGIATEVSK